MNVNGGEVFYDAGGAAGNIIGSKSIQ